MVEAAIMSLVNVENVEVLDNPAKFNTPFNFLITFECFPPGIKEGIFRSGFMRWICPFIRVLFQS